MRVPDPKANTTTEAYLAYKAGYLEESELKPVLYEPYLHFDAWLAYWAGLTTSYPNNMGKNLFIAQASASSYGMENTQDPTTGMFHITGTATQNWATTFRGKSIYLPAGTYTISITKVLPFKVVVRIWERPGDESSRRDYSIPAGQTSFTFTTNFNGRIVGGYSTDLVPGREYDETFGVQLEKSPVATDFEPATIIPEILCDEEALVAYLAEVTDTYPEEIKDPYDVRIVGYLKYLVSVRYGRPEYPVNNEEFYLSTMTAPVIPSGDPSSSIELDGTAEAPFASLEAYGDTTQQTYSGKNLFNITSSAKTATRNGVKITIAPDGLITLDGESTGATWPDLTWGIGGNTVEHSTCKYYFPTTISNAVFSLKYVSGTASGGSVTVRLNDNGGVDVNIPFTSPDTFRTMQNVSGVNRAYITQLDAGTTFDNFSFYLQIEYGSSPTSYEPYCGGIPSPNPDYPQNVNVVTGEQTVDVYDKNLYSPIPGAHPEHGIGATYDNSTGEITLIGTGNDTWSNTFQWSAITLPPGKYTVSLTNTIPLNARIRFLYNDNTYVDGGIPSGEKTVTVTTTNEAKGVRLWFSGTDGTNVNGVKFKIQVEAGEAATDFQLHGRYPINLGKNMLNISDFAMGGLSNGQPSASDYRINNALSPIKVLPSTTYTLSVQLGSTVKGYRVGVHECKKDGTFIRDLGWKQLVPGSYSFTTDSDTYIIKLVGSLSTTSDNVTTGSTENTTSCSTVEEFMRGCKLQFELGSISTSMSDYFTPIELCKIGDYQDYIYKSGDDWYLHKEIGKDTLDGTEIFQKSGANENVSFYWARNYSGQVPRFANIRDSLITEIGAGIDYVFPFFANNFARMSTNQVIYTSSIGAGFNRPSSSNLNFRMGMGLDTTINDVTKFTNFVKSNPITVYYPLERFSDTEITDQSLISQLDAIVDGGSYNGKTYINVSAAGNNLPALLKVEAYKY